VRDLRKKKVKVSKQSQKWEVYVLGREGPPEEGKKEEKVSLPKWQCNANNDKECRERWGGAKFTHNRKRVRRSEFRGRGQGGVDVIIKRAGKRPNENHEPNAA